MPIEYYKNNFIIWPDATHTPSLGVESDRLQECLAEVERRGLKGVFGAPSFFRENNLDFLATMPWLEAAEFWEVRLKSLSGLYALKNLQFLRVSGGRPPLNFDSFPNLHSLVWEYNLKDSGCQSLPVLEQLYLCRYKSVNKTFDDIALPNCLKRLEINWSNVSTLDGLPYLPMLSHLEIGRCRDLNSLGDLAARCPNLESLFIVSSGRLHITEAERIAASLPKLRHLVAANKLLIDPNMASPLPRW